MKTWTYPLHMIDFETTALAIPMHKGMKPYEGVAFQFSHHTIQADGTVAHVGEYLNMEKGMFPNFDFVRALKEQLEGDEGTIFRYHNHENTYLNMILKQLRRSKEADKVELIDFIKSITKPTGDMPDKWKAGARNMVDLYQVVLKFYIHPMMKGSNSIKMVLPAVLNDSTFLKDKYSKPVYGTDITSLNFTSKVWVEYNEDGSVQDPYKLLKPVFPDLDDEQIEGFMSDDGKKLNDGGAAMMAYANMQFTEMPDAERKYMGEALLRYCELDTLAMVMIYEHWKSIV